jgi:hypothetical protein
VVAGAAATVVLSAALVLSRSRAAMLALIAFGVILAIGAWRLRARWGLRGTGRRFEVLAACAMAGVIAAVLLPNTLNWKSDSPYLDTVTGVVNYREGSGRGRLVQYTNTLHMTKEHPLLGVGPGNWSVQYPHYAARDDPSIDQDDGMTSNPWPSSDWAAFVSERGAIATGVLLLALVGLAAGALLAMSRASRPDQYLAGLALLGTVVTTVIVGAFDAVLLLPAPALLVWALLGALAPAAKTRLAMPLGGTARRWAAVAAGAMWVCFVARSAGQLAAMSMFTASTHVKEMEQASLADPGSYRIHLRLAQLGVERGSCERARRHGSRAHALFPNAPEPRRLLARCGIRVRRTG